MLADGLPQVGEVDVRRQVAVAWAVEDVDDLVVFERLFGLRSATDVACYDAPVRANSP